MKGLLKNNVYAVLSNAKLFSAMMLVLGIFVVGIDHDAQIFIIGYMLLCMTGFSVIAAASLRRESVSKWSKYKLTAPIRRTDIVKSYFLSQMAWLCIGMLLAGTAAALSILFYGFPFDKDTDIFMVYVVGIGLSLFMGAIFFPLFYLGGEEHSEMLIGVSLLGGVGVIMGASSLMNRWFGPHMTAFQIMTAGAAILVCALLAFFLSFLLTVRIFQKKEL